MEEGNEGRLDVCCLGAARSSQLGRVSGRSTDWPDDLYHRYQE